MTNNLLTMTSAMGADSLEDVFKSIELLDAKYPNCGSYHSEDGYTWYVRVSRDALVLVDTRRGDSSISVSVDGIELDRVSLGGDRVEVGGEQSMRITVTEDQLVRDAAVIEALNSLILSFAIQPELGVKGGISRDSNRSLGASDELSWICNYTDSVVTVKYNDNIIIDLPLLSGVLRSMKAMINDICGSIPNDLQISIKDGIWVGYIMKPVKATLEVPADVQSLCISVGGSDDREVVLPDHSGGVVTLYTRPESYPINLELATKLGILVDYIYDYPLLSSAIAGCRQTAHGLTIEFGNDSTLTIPSKRPLHRPQVL